MTQANDSIAVTPGSGGGGDMTLDNNVLALGQQVTITAFAINAGGA